MDKIKNLFRSGRYLYGKYIKCKAAGYLNIPLYLLRRHRLAHTVQTAEPNISVVITTKNNATHLEACLKSILDQKYTHYEIIVVDYGDDYETKQIVERINTPRMRYFTYPVTNFIQMRALNFGIEKAKGDIICCIDGDIIVSSIYLKCIALAFENNKNIFYECCKIRSRDTRKRFSLNFFSAEKIFHSYGATQAMTAENFHQSGGYLDNYPTIFAYDTELKERAIFQGLRYSYDRSNIIYHPRHPDRGRAKARSEPGKEIEQMVKLEQKLIEYYRKAKSIVPQDKKKFHKDCYDTTEKIDMLIREAKEFRDKI